MLVYQFVFIDWTRPLHVCILIHENKVLYHSVNFIQLTMVQLVSNLFIRGGG